MLTYSIVIPVYNVEKYLKRCLNSILKQEYKDFEIILVDDGSSDSSGKICDEFAGNHKVSVIHKQNEGQAKARNIGIQEAKGEYIIFIDSDDFIKSKYLLGDITDAISNNEGECDVLTFGCLRIVESTGIIRERPYGGLAAINHIKKEERMLWMMKNGKFSSAPWLHVIRRQYIIERGLFFDEEYRSAEDIKWIIDIILSRPSIIGINNQDYCYSIREGSLVTSHQCSRFWEDRYNAIKYGINKNKDGKNKELEMYLATQLCILIGEIYEEPNRNVKKQIYSELKKYKKFIRLGKDKKTFFASVITNICGLERTSKILNQRVKRRRNAL